MMEKKEEILKDQAKKISIAEGSAYTLMEGFGLRNITPYLLEVGKKSANINFFVGLLSSIPSLLGNFSQLLTARLMEKYSRKKIVFWGIFAQAIMWLFLLIPGFLYFYLGKNSTYSALIVIIIYSMLIIAGSIPGPAWASWMKAIVSKPEERGKYFGKRNKICGTFALIFALIGGFILDYFKHTEIFVGFIILFFFSFVGRSISAYLFTKQYEPKFRLEKKYYFSFLDFVKKMRFNNFGRFTIFIAMFSGAVAFASPFFAVYELKDLNLSYIVFVILGISASISSLLSMTFWGRISDKYGTLKVMKVTGFFIGLIPILWISSIFLINNFYLMFATLFIMELFNGLIWAGFNLSAGNFIYNSVTQERIGICTSYYNLINAVVVFVFATLGGLLANANFSFTSHSILIVFAVSGILRFLAYFLFFHKIKENPYENSIQKNETLLQLTKEFLDKVRFEKLF